MSHSQLMIHGQLMKNQGVSLDYWNEFFSLYIVSPHLELQLLPAHEPFRLLSCWNSILSQYTSVKRETVLVDDPILSYQRNIFLKRHEEAIVEDALFLELLYEEAKVNILTGRYPYHDYESLASIQAAIELGPYQPRVHCASYFKLKDYIYLPLHYRQRIKKSSNQSGIGNSGIGNSGIGNSGIGKRGIGKRGIGNSGIGKSLQRFFGSPTTTGAGKVHPPPSASRLFHNNPQRSQSSDPRAQSSRDEDGNSYSLRNEDTNSYNPHAQSSRNEDTNSYDPHAQSGSPYARIMGMFRSIYQHAHPSRIELIRSYLSRCWSLPYYGSAFFPGQIEMLCECRIKRIITQSLDRSVYVGVNWEGIHVIDRNYCSSLISLPYDQFKWQLGHPHHTNLHDSARNGSHMIQCLFIQVTIKDSARESGGRECKIFQIFSKSSPLIASLIKHFSSHAQLTDVPDSGSFREDLVMNTKPIDESMIAPLERISCATFNAKGECIKFQGSISVLT